METYISILRGINVSGHRKIQMTDLHGLYEQMGLKDVVTYIQSGNVVFKAPKTTSNRQLSKTLEKAIFDKYGFEVPVIVRTNSEIKEVIAASPFLQKGAADLEKLHITFLAEQPTEEKLKLIERYKYPPDEYIINGKEVYLYCPGGYGNTKLSNTFFEGKLKVTATTRNWKTVTKLLELSSR